MVHKEWSRVTLEKLADIKVARIILNRPEKRNALDRQMIEEILSALEEVRTDSEMRVVITKGNGPSFCSGLDLHYLRSVHEQPPGDWDRASPPMTLFEAIRNFAKIMIAQVHGYCLGGVDSPENAPGKKIIFLPRPDYRRRRKNGETCSPHLAARKIGLCRGWA